MAREVRRSQYAQVAMRPALGYGQNRNIVGSYGGPGAMGFDSQNIGDPNALGVGFWHDGFLGTDAPAAGTPAAGALGAAGASSGGGSKKWADAPAAGTPAAGASGAAGAGGSSYIDAASQFLTGVTTSAIGAASSGGGSKKCARLLKRAAKVKKADKRARLQASANAYCSQITAGDMAGAATTYAATDAALNAEGVPDDTIAGVEPTTLAAGILGLAAAAGLGYYLYKRSR